MATKPKNPDAAQTAAELSETLKESAQQIWLAGLGAFAKAQEEGGKVFETLVKEGTTLQRKSQAATEERLAETGSRMAGLAGDLTAKAAGQWDKLENLFEARVAKALKNLGAPSTQDLQVLQARVDELARQVERLAAGSAASAPRRAASGRPGAPQAAKRSIPRKSS